MDEENEVALMMNMGWNDEGKVVVGRREEGF
jgi:hypothetical protein